MNITILRLRSGNYSRIVAHLSSLFGECDINIVELPHLLSHSKPDILVIPGVGSFEAASRSLSDSRSTAILKEFILDPKILTICICLGLQLLFDSSTESIDSREIRGLGIYPFKVKRFASNKLNTGFRLISHDSFQNPHYAFFNHHFMVPVEPNILDNRFSFSEYNDQRFISTILDKKYSIVATQFHPELSGQAGSTIMKTLVRITGWIS